MPVAGTVQLAENVTMVELGLGVIVAFSVAFACRVAFAFWTTVD